MKRNISKRSEDFSFWIKAHPTCNNKNELLEVVLSILNDRTWIKLELTHNEWKNLMTFLRQTIDKKNIPKNKICFRGFHIDTNKIEYYSERLNSAQSDLLNSLNPDPDVWRSEKEDAWAKAKSITENVKKVGLDKSLFINKGDVEIYFKRTHFLRFRIFCLGVGS